MGYIPRVFDLHGWKDEEFFLPEGRIGLSQGWKDEKFLLPECATYPSSDVHDGWMGEKFLLPQGWTPLVGLVLPAGSWSCPGPGWKNMNL